MAISYVQSAKNALHGVTTITCAFPANNTAGNLIVVGLGIWNTTSATPAISDSQGNTYTKITSLVGGASSRSTLWYAPNCGGGANTVTITSAGGPDVDIIIAEYGAASALEANAAVASSSPLAFPSITTTDASELVVVWGYNASQAGGTWSVSPSIGSGWTLRQQTSNPDGAAGVFFDTLGVPAGTYSETVTAAGVTTNSTEAIIASFIAVTAVANQPCSFICM